MKDCKELIMGQSVTSLSNSTLVERDGVLYISLHADETTGGLWAPRLESRRYNLSPDAERILRSSSFSLSRSGPIKCAILRGSLFSNEERTTSKIRVIATERFGLTKPETDQACLARERLSVSDIEKILGLTRIVFMHEPHPRYGYLDVHRNGIANYLGTLGGRKNPDDELWSVDKGFAFEALCD